MAKPTSGWKSYEVYERDENGIPASTSFSDALAGGSGRLAKQALTKMRMLEELGLQRARSLLRDDNGHPLIVKKDEKIWLLKCKPSCWRLYFYATDQKEVKRIIYVYAVCKKKNRENPQDAIEARKIADGIGGAGSAIAPIEFPTN